MFTPETIYIYLCIKTKRSMCLCVCRLANFLVPFETNADSNRWVMFHVLSKLSKEK